MGTSTAELWVAVDMVKAIRKSFEPADKTDLCWLEYQQCLELETLLRRLATASDAEKDSS